MKGNYRVWFETWRAGMKFSGYCEMPAKDDDDAVNKIIALCRKAKDNMSKFRVKRVEAV